MYKRKTLIIMLIFLPFLLFSQDNNPDIEEDWEIYETDSYMRGDQTFMISIGTIFPVIFFNDGSKIDHNFNPPVGGTGALTYNYYITSNFYVGGEISGAFNSTLGQNTVFLIPIGLRFGYQFSYKKFDFPITYTLGMNWHRYLNDSYFGLYMKLGGAFFYRVSSRWSFGSNVNWGWYPEWTNDSSKNVHGFIVDLTLCARYHF